MPPSPSSLRLPNRFSAFWSQHWFVCLLPVAFTLSWFSPEIAATGGWLRPEVTTKIGVALIFLLQGLLLPTAQMRAALGQVKLHGVIQGMTFVGFPLLGLSAAFVFGRWLPDELRIGLVYLSVLPSTVSSAAVLTATAGGNTAGAICNAVLSSLLGIVLTPLLVAFALHTQDISLATSTASGANGSPPHSGGIDAGRIVLELIKLILVPLLVGQILRLRLGGWATKHKKRLGTLSTAVILFIVFAAFCNASRAEVWTRHGLAMPVAALVIAVGLFALATGITRALIRAAGLPPADALAAEFCSVQKTLASGVPLAGVIFAGDSRVGLILLPLLIYHPLQLTLHGARAAREAARRPSA